MGYPDDASALRYTERDMSIQRQTIKLLEEQLAAAQRGLVSKDAAYRLEIEAINGKLAAAQKDLADLKERHKHTLHRVNTFCDREVDLALQYSEKLYIAQQKAESVSSYWEGFYKEKLNAANARIAKALDLWEDYIQHMIRPDSDNQAERALDVRLLKRFDDVLRGKEGEQ